MKTRIVEEEILDSLPAHDPEAIRSRRDLGRINALMGNYRWIARKLGEPSEHLSGGWIEIGAGDGPLAQYISSSSITLTAIDLAPRPSSWPQEWDWWQADLFDSLESAVASRTGLIANLFLHHLKEEELHRLGRILDERFVRIIVSEPARYLFFDRASHLLLPFVNRVTKHDMIVSIRAGFRRGELAEFLGLGSEWKIEESMTPLGAYRFSAWRD